MILKEASRSARSQVERHLEAGHSVILEIDWQGARQVRESMPACVTIFVMPPSLQELERRLRDRRTDSAEVIERRLRDALGDMSHWDEFDHIIINDDLEQAVADLNDVILGQGHASTATNASLRDALVRSRTMLINTVRGWLRTQLIKLPRGSKFTFTRRVGARWANNAVVSLPPSSVSSW